MVILCVEWTTLVCEAIFCREQASRIELNSSVMFSAIARAMYHLQISVFILLNTVLIFTTGAISHGRKNCV